MRPLPWRRWASRERSWSTATPRPCRPTTTPPTSSYFEPLTLEDVLNIHDQESCWRDGVSSSSADKHRSISPKPPVEAGRQLPRVPAREHRHLRRPRAVSRSSCSRNWTSSPTPSERDRVTNDDQAFEVASRRSAIPVVVRPLRPRRPRHGDRLRRRRALKPLHEGGRPGQRRKAGPHRPLPGGRHRGGRRCDRRWGGNE